MRQKILLAFPALEYRNFQVFFFSQFISLLGTWIHIVAQGWLVFQITQSAFWVGVVAAFGFLPVTLFSLPGGVLVDRMNKRKLFIYAQAISLVLSLILAGLTYFGLINLQLICLLTFLMGAVNSVDHPARQTLIIDMVEGKNIHSAVALNSTMFNSARIMGPALAGFLISIFGIAGAFFINALTFLSPIIALSKIRIPSQRQPASHPHPIRAIKQGLDYVYHHSVIKTLIIYASVISVFGWSYMTILPVIAEEVFFQDATGLGYLYSASGAGSIIGALFISAFSKKFKYTHLILFGSLLFSLSLISFSLTANFHLGLFLLLLSGIGLATQNTMIQTTVQKNIDPTFRGRVMSLYTLVFIGFAPLGSFQLGVFAEEFTSPIAIRSSALIVLLSALIFQYMLRKTKPIKLPH